MAVRFTVSLPEGLHARARNADLNLSALLADRVRDELGQVDGCEHKLLRCQSCGAHVEAFPELGELDEEPEDVEQLGETAPPAS